MNDIPAHGSHGQFLILNKGVITYKSKSFHMNHSKNKNKLSIIIPNKLIPKISIGNYMHKRNIIISKIQNVISSKISINKQNYKTTIFTSHLVAKVLKSKYRIYLQRITIACCCSSVCISSW